MADAAGAPSPLASLPSLVGRGRTLFAPWIGTGEPTIADALAREPFDAVIFDQQHGAIDLAATMEGVRIVAAHGKPAVARIPVGHFSEASRLCDAGASAIIAPMINTLADARAFADSVKYPPLGRRSWGPFRAQPASGLDPRGYLANANRFTLAIAMIETREALGLLDDILAVPGLDGVFVGPSDLSIALTNGATVDPLHPEVETALDHARARSRAVGKMAWVYCHDAPRARTLAERGYDLCAIANDLVMLRAGATAMLKTARGA